MRIAWALLSLLVLASFDPVTARELKISHQWPAEADARDRATRVFVKEVLARSPGTTFQIYPQLQLKMKAEEQFAALQSGAIDLSVYPLPYAVKQVPEFSLSVLPCLYPSLDTVKGIKGTQVAVRLQSIANAHGVHILGWWWVPGGFVTRDREISGPSSVKGLKLRGGDPMFDLMLKKAGAIPVELTSNEIYSAMQSGRLDGALTSYETFVSTKIYEQGKHFTAGSPGIWMFATPLLISKRVWDELSDGEQEAFEAAAQISEEYFAATQMAAEARFIETFKRAGAKYQKFTQAEYLAWLQLAQQTAWKEYLKISPTTESMLREVVQTILVNSNKPR
jgi:TRAP-type C4-dicarboxylate transport system substrate-binding protein